MYAATDHQATVTCPNCRWHASGGDRQALQAAKDHHLMYRCPDEGTEATTDRIITD